MKTPSAMRHVVWLLLLTIGCQPATHYEKLPKEAAVSTKPTPRETEPTPPDPTLAWIDRRPQTAQPAVPIVFVHETAGAEWVGLPKFWNPPPTDAEKAAAALALGPLTAVAPLAETKAVVKIKVPAGLDDPRPYLPASDPPTLDKWELGRRLFYDQALLGEGVESCATCHDPRTGFADNGLGHFGVNTPTLINCVFNRRQFWDGRVAALEEVVQRTPEDETAPPAKDSRTFRHVWGGVVRRLRSSAGYTQLFLNAFGTPPTQDAVGKALATYLRTLLADDSVYDRALRVQSAERAPQLAAAYYEKVLDEAALKKLGLEGKPKADAAKRINEGYRLFHDLEEHKAGCVRCHSGREFTDGGFHNLGVGFREFLPGREPGRFASLPLGEKDRTLIGAYKTPTLRGLLRTAPYFHDGSAATLEEAVQFHLKGGEKNEYLDAELRDPKDADRQRVSDLTPQEVSDLVLFLRALDGEDVDAAVGPPAAK